jgi:hypothetical protein
MNRRFGRDTQQTCTVSLTEVLQLGPGLSGYPLPEYSSCSFLSGMIRS